MPTRDPVDVVRAILAAPTDLDAVSRLVAEDATSVSFRTRGMWRVESDPEGGEVTVGTEDA